MGSSLRDRSAILQARPRPDPVGCGMLAGSAI